MTWQLKDERERLLSLRWAGSEFQFEGPAYANERPPYDFHTWEVEMTTFSRSQVATTRNAGDGLAVGWQVFRNHLVQSSGRGLWTEPYLQRPASIADFALNEWVPGRTWACSRRIVLPSWGRVASCRSVGRLLRNAIQETAGLSDPQPQSSVTSPPVHPVPLEVSTKILNMLCMFSLCSLEK